MHKIDAEIGHLLQELPPEPLKTEQEPSTRQGDPFKQAHAMDETAFGLKNRKALQTVETTV